MYTDHNIFDVLQRVLVRLHGIKNIHVNKARHKMFSRKLKDKDKTADMSVSVLQPCESILCLKNHKANYTAAISKQATISQSGCPNTLLHGWNIDKSITWVIGVFPEEFEKSFSTVITILMILKILTARVKIKERQIL